MNLFLKNIYYFQRQNFHYNLNYAKDDDLNGFLGLLHLNYLLLSIIIQNIKNK